MDNLVSLLLEPRFNMVLLSAELTFLGNLPSQVCQYDGSTGGTELSPLLVNCCCDRCDTDKITCAADSITGSGLWQTTKYSPLCPEEPCGSHGFGDVTSPNFPHFNYPNNLEKNQIIQVESGKVLRLEFTHFAVEWEPTCQYDYVRITDGNGSILMNNSCGYSSVDPSEPNFFLPPVITSHTNVTSIHLRTNNLRTDPGWSLSWTAVTPS